MKELFFGGWPQLGKTVLLGISAYFMAVLMLRVSGKRTLANMDPFDFVITTALGSTMATVTLDAHTTVAQGAAAFATLIGLQFSITWLTRRSRLVRRIVKPHPRLLYYRGRFLHDALDHDHVPEIEILSAVRKHGYASLDDVEAVVLETGSDFSVIAKVDCEGKRQSAFGDVEGAPEEVRRDLHEHLEAHHQHA